MSVEAEDVPALLQVYGADLTRAVEDDSPCHLAALQEARDRLRAAVEIRPLTERPSETLMYLIHYSDGDVRNGCYMRSDAKWMFSKWKDPALVAGWSEFL